ncbi:hypothetical protein J3R83DRAFT_1614 [Lanmaoa asiatica]|nr:hypothetical protein J3R83DRAFT_1614 [Lanmaoa asiatica]
MSIHPSLVYTYIITNFGVVEELGNVVWSLDVQIFFNAFTTLFVQCFLAMRVYRLSNKSWLATGTVMILVIAEFLATIVFSIEALPLNTFVEFATLNVLSVTINALGAATDIIIATLLCFMLHRSRTGLRKSDYADHQVVSVPLLPLICISVWPHAWIYIAFYFCSGRLYCNTLLATLNARKGLKGGSRNDDMSLSFQGHTAQQKTNHTMIGRSSKQMPNNISIKIDTTQEYVRDEVSSVYKDTLFG